MPWLKVWGKPEQFLEYKGLTVYHVHPKGDIDFRHRYCYCVCPPEGDSYVDFDVRSLPWYQPSREDNLRDYHARLIRQAIDLGLLTEYGLKR